MFRRCLASITLYVCLIVFLSACSSSKTIRSYKDIPIHPQAKALEMEYFMSHTVVGLGWSMTDKEILGGPYEGYQVQGQGFYGITEQSPDPTIEAFYDEELTGWTKQVMSLKDEFTGLNSTRFTWSKDKQVVVILTYLDESQTNLLIVLLKGK